MFAAWLFFEGNFNSGGVEVIKTAQEQFTPELFFTMLEEVDLPLFYQSFLRLYAVVYLS